MRILFVPDVHFPYESPGLMSFLKDVKRKYGPFDEVVQAGDMFDFLAFKKFPKAPDEDSVNQEVDAAKIQAGKLAEIFPQITITTGNHEARLFKRTAEVGVPSRFLKSFHDLLDLPSGWEFVNEYETDGILFMHGDGISGQGAMGSLIQRFRKNICIGHLHGQAGVMWLNNGKSTSFGLVGGCLIDRNALAFKYGQYAKDQPVLGCWIIEDQVPRFIPFYVPKGGRK
jgi:hypothetical protein